MLTPTYLTENGQSQGAGTAGPFTRDSVGNIYQESYEDALFTYRIVTWFHEFVGISGSIGWRAPQMG